MQKLHYLRSMKAFEPSRHKTIDSRLAFGILAFIAVVLQLGALQYATGTYKSILWYTSHSAGWLHSLLIWLSDAIVLTLPIWLIRRHWRWPQWILLLSFFCWGIAQLMYFPTYCDLMPLSSFVLWQNLDSMVIDSALGNWLRRDWLFVFPLAALAVADLCWLRRCTSPSPTRSSGWRRLGYAMLAFVVLRVASDALAYRTYWHDKLSVSEYLNDNYTHVKVSHASYMADNGLIGYLTYCTAVELAQHKCLPADDERRIEQFLSEQPKYSDNTYSAGRDNLILIVVESLNSWVVDFRLDGREVTPVLNALCADTTNIVGKHMRRQVKNGGSSDGHFMFNTGLLPLEQRAVAMVYPDANYPTLLEAMGVENSSHICADPPALWNTELTARTYGYRDYHGSQEVRPLLRMNDWQWDKIILERASEEIGHLAPPFVAQIITLGMHEPFTRTDVPESWISQSQQYTLKVRNYLERTAVFDRELGLFLSRLKQQGMYDNSLIVIVSDHNDHVDNEPSGRPSIDPDGQDCLFLVVNSGRGMHIEQPFGQIDVYPTLLDLTGSNAYGWKGLGQSLLRGIPGTVAQGPNDTVGGSELQSRQHQAWDISRLLITSRWFDRHPVTNR